MMAWGVTLKIEKKIQQLMLAIVFHTSKYKQIHSNTVYPNVYIYIYMVPLVSELPAINKFAELMAHNV